MRRLLLVLLIVCAPLSGNEGNLANATGGMQNGRFWMQLPAESYRLVYLVGLEDGLFISGKQKRCNCTRDEEVAGITKFYSEDPSYLAIPVPWARLIYEAKAMGAKPEEVNAMVRQGLAMASGVRPQE